MQAQIYPQLGKGNYSDAWIRIFETLEHSIWVWTIESRIYSFIFVMDYPKMFYWLCLISSIVLTTVYQAPVMHYIRFSTSYLSPGLWPICSKPSACCTNQLFEFWPASMGATIPELVYLSHPAPELPTNDEAWGTRGTFHTQPGSSVCGMKLTALGSLDQFFSPIASWLAEMYLIGPLRISEQLCLMATSSQPSHRYLIGLTDWLPFYFPFLPWEFSP